jgi:hypothetical protein
MAKSYLTDINLNKNSLLNAKVHVWGSPGPSGTTLPDGTGTAIQGQISSYQGALYIFNGTAWVQVGNALSDSTSTTSSTTGASSTAVKAAYDLAALAIPKAGNVSVTGPLSFGSTNGTNGNSITGLNDPSGDYDAVNKKYVDTIAAGLNAHPAVNYATTGALGTAGNLVGGTITTTYSNGSSGVGATLTIATSSNWTAITIDGQPLTAGDRVLIKNQGGTTSNLQNGIYTVTTLGAVGNTTSFVFTRALDYNSTPEVAPGDITYVLAGTANGKNGFVQTAVISAIGTTPIAWSQFSGASTTLAGEGLVTNTNNPNQLDIATASTARIVVNAENIDLALVNPTTTGTAGSSTVVQSHTVDNYGRVSATTYAAVPYTALATGTTTATTYALSVTTTSGRKATGTFSNSPAVGTPVTVNHGWGLVVAQVFDSSGAQVEVDVATSSGITTFTPYGVSLNGYQYVIIG